ncbi:MAG TPA: hypothetical protein VIV10_01885, partial [Gemmatimonadales bacterium]
MRGALVVPVARGAAALQPPAAAAADPSALDAAGVVRRTMIREPVTGAAVVPGAAGAAAADVAMGRLRAVGCCTTMRGGLR